MTEPHWAMPPTHPNVIRLRQILSDANAADKKAAAKRLAGYRGK